MRDVPEGVITLEECLQLFTSEETLDQANSWYCGTCKTHRQATKTIQFWRLPKILIIGLKRFEQMSGVVLGYGNRLQQGVHREKISTFVDFPIDGLDISPFCSTSRRRSSATDSTHDPYIYDLYAVVNHYGRMGFGHYTAFARDWDGRTAAAPQQQIDPSSQQSSSLWCSYDDDLVHVVDEKTIKTSAAYILFYRQRASIE